MLNLKVHLNILTQLQELDSEIYHFKAQKNSAPVQIEALKTAFEQKKQKLTELDKEALELTKQKKDKEMEMGSKEEAIKKLQSQLYQLKTNNEYKIMLKQIDDSKADNSFIEDKILEIMEKIDNLKNTVESERKLLAQEEIVFNQEKAKIENTVKEIEQKLTQLETQREQLTPGIDKKILSQYNKILSNRNGLAIATVTNNSCQGCHMFVPPQVINLIKMYERIITCEVCNRILYTED
ncbi:MAG: C4-type zinc ribbon domain-containing protein [Candidatus Omnitrophota bacterium]